MNHHTYTFIKVTMHEYVAKGKPSYYKKKQMKRLIEALNEMMLAENKQLNEIGRKQIIKYYCRHSHESYKTLKEKYSIIKRFFSKYKPIVRVPKPKEERCGIES